MIRNNKYLVKYLKKNKYSKLAFKYLKIILLNNLQITFKYFG